MTDCLFCKIVAGEIPAAKVYEDDHAIAFRDIDPKAPVHDLIIPRTHVASIADLPDTLAGPMLRAIQAVAVQEGVAEGFRVVTNHGPEAGQSVFHLHFHLLGGRRMTWPPG